VGWKLNNSCIHEDKITKAIEALKSNGFEVFFAQNHIEAEQLFWDEIFNKIKPKNSGLGRFSDITFNRNFTRIKRKK
jgi:hypothetical protein